MSPLDQEKEDDSNVDVHMELSDGRIYSFVVATPKNIYRCMDSDGTDYFFGFPPVFVRTLSQEGIEEALRALLTECNGRWLSVYGALQEHVKE